MKEINLVKAYRAGCGLSQEEMAEVIGVHANTYRALEENPRKFSIEQIDKFMAEINKYDVNAKASIIFLNQNCGK